MPLLYLLQIKERFRDDEPRYKDFLSIMIELKNKGLQVVGFADFVELEMDRPFRK